MKLRCGVVGLGRIGCGFDDNPNAEMTSTHAGAYYNNHKMDLTAFCDIDEKKLEKYGKKYKVRNRYTRYKDMLENEKLDCISICTWANSHLEIVENAVKSGVRGIFLEKPISDSLKDADKIKKICKKNNVKLQIDYQRRFDPAYNALKKDIRNKIGKIQHVNIYYGAGISNTGSHICDLVRFLFGDIKWVEGKFSNNPSNNKMDPNIDGKIVCKNNIQCSLQGFDYEKFGLIEFDIIGTKSRIKLNLTTSQIEYFEAVPPKTGLFYNELVARQYKSSPKVSAITKGLENLIDAIEKNKNTLSGADEGYLSLEAVIALMISAEKNGKKIPMPVNNNTYKIVSR